MQAVSDWVTAGYSCGMNDAGGAGGDSAGGTAIG